LLRDSQKRTLTVLESSYSYHYGKYSISFQVIVWTKSWFYVTYLAIGVSTKSSHYNKIIGNVVSPHINKSNLGAEVVRICIQFTSVQGFGIWHLSSHPSADTCLSTIHWCKYSRHLFSALTPCVWHEMGAIPNLLYMTINYYEFMYFYYHILFFWCCLLGDRNGINSRKSIHSSNKWQYVCGTSQLK